MQARHSLSIPRKQLSFGEVEARTVFKPEAWIVLSFIMYFLVPAVVSIAITRSIKGYGDLNFPGWQIEIIDTIAASALFILVTLVSLVFVRKLFPARRHFEAYSPPKKAELVVARGSFITGLFCAYLLGQAFSGDMRSGLVSTLYGQLIFAISFGAILGYLALALRALNKKNYIWFAIITLVFVSAFVVLGGRGRVIWPLLSLFATWQITRKGKIHLGKLLGWGLVIFFAASLIDPLLAIYYGRGTDQLLRIASTGSLLESVFIQKRNFDGFHNFYLIFNIDPFPRSLSYLIDGPRTTFMTEFFPAILARGIGFPATVPGTFWMAGGWIGLIIGGIAFGALAGVMSARFSKSQSQLSICFQIYLFTWIFNVGTSLFDNMSKIIVVCVIMIPFYLASKLR
ncbi:hypothetical protein [Loktanella sp. F6476L]|uniref:hypothetical protein n=1 Tax=Loktanella sp. F6476L TaxID=2926405 RepID=UPI001FF1769C|nr:hypothetical protein [Loktanella sp. F6476L]